MPRSSNADKDAGGVSHAHRIAASARGHGRKPRVQPLDAVIGGRVRMRRIALGMSQEALAGALDVSFQQVQKYEKGRNRIGAGRLAQIAACLRVPAAFFFELAQGPGESRDALDPVARCLASTDGLALARAFGRIENPALRRRVITLAEQLAAQATGTTVELQG